MLKNNLIKITLAIICLIIFKISTATAHTQKILVSKKQNPEVIEFIDYMVKTHKFDKQELTKLFKNTNYNKNVIKAISRPAEAWPWHKYESLFLKEKRIKNGVKFWQEHLDTLNKASNKYGVPPEIIISILGVETLYGENKGKYSVLESLATLGFYYKPRAKFFRKELEHFLVYAKEEKADPNSYMGSYAGAMGYPQFISSSIRNYAVDFSKDGKRDLNNNIDDAIGSIANYFNKNGWKKDELITTILPVNNKQEQELNKALNNKINNLKPSIKLEKLNKLGINIDIDTANKQYYNKQLLSVFSFEQKDSSKEYRVGFNNFYVITRYNISQNYALAVYLLSEEIKKQYQQTMLSKS